MLLRRAARYFLAATISLAAVASCKKKDDDDTETTPATSGTTTDPAAGVRTPSQEGEVAMAGTLTLGAFELAGSVPTHVIGFLAVAGEIKGVEEAVEATVAADGTFSLSLPKISPLIATIESAEQPDGSYDRAKIEEAIGEEIDDSVTDAMISEFVEEMKTQAERGGVTYILVAMTESGDKVAEAESFRFIGLSDGDSILNGLPISAAKGDIGLGNISAEGDQATAELELSTTAFDISEAALGAMTSTSNAVKMVKNLWMNSNGEESYTPMPFFMWSASPTNATSDYTDADATSYTGSGMYLKAVGRLTFGEVCDPANDGDLTLAPPAPISAGRAGTISADRPFDNGGLTAIKSESSRMNCGGEDTGFYAAGVDADDNDLMINWGTGGDVAEPTPDGLFKLAWKGENIANFELASSYPLDADGNPLVFIPVAKFTKDSSNVITGVQVKLYLWSNDAYVEVEDTQAFEMTASGFNIEFTARDLQGNSTDERVSLLDNIEGNVFSPNMSEFENTWQWYGTTASGNNKVLTTVALYYEMFNSSYRVELRDQ